MPFFFFFEINLTQLVSQSKQSYPRAFQERVYQRFCVSKRSIILCAN